MQPCEGRTWVLLQVCGTKSEVVEGDSDIKAGSGSAGGGFEGGLEQSGPQMRREGEKGRNVCGFVLKISRKLRDRCLPVLALEQVTGVTVFFILRGQISWEREMLADLRSNVQRWSKLKYRF